MCFPVPSLSKAVTLGDLICLRRLTIEVGSFGASTPKALKSVLAFLLSLLILSSSHPLENITLHIRFQLAWDETAIQQPDWTKLGDLLVDRDTFREFTTLKMLLNRMGDRGQVEAAAEETKDAVEKQMATLKDRGGLEFEYLL